MLDSGNFNTTQVNINKSVTILAVPGVLGSVVIPDFANAIYIDASSASVTLRNLTIVNLGGNPAQGVVFNQGTKLLVDGCDVNGVNEAFAAAIRVSAGVATITNSTLRNSTYGVAVDGNARATVINSIMMNNDYGALAGASAGETSQLTVTHSTITGAAIYGLFVGASAGGSANLVSDANVLTFINDVYGFGNEGGSETIWTRQNNTTGFYNKLISGGSLTVLDPS